MANFHDFEDLNEAQLRVLSQREAAKKALLSARASALLVQAAFTDGRFASYKFYQIFREGREAIQTAINELKENGYVETNRRHIKGRFVCDTVITSKGRDHLRNVIGIPERALPI